MRFTLYNEDVLTALAKVEDDSIDCIITSPPYWGLRDYGIEGQLGLEPDYKDYLNHMLQVTAELKRVLKPTGTMWWNHGDTYCGNKEGKTDKKVSDYVLDSQKELHKTIQEGISEKSRMMLPERLAMRMIDEQNWTLRNDIVWNKPNHMPSSVKDRLSNGWGHIYFFTKARKYYFNLDAIRVSLNFPEDVARRIKQDHEANVRQWDKRKGTRKARATKHEIATYRDRYNATYHDALHTKPNHPLGKNPGDVWRITTKPYKEAHFATFPPDLPERCIKAGCPEEGTVLDPFAGSGTTLIVALKLKRNAVAIELKKEYCTLIQKRIAPYINQSYLV